jgi:FtsZ-binding cell division protein ZapB
VSEDFHAKLRAHRAHMAAVPGALGAVKTALEIVPPGPGQVITLASDTLTTLVNEVERLQSREKQLLQDMRDEQREFQREARDIAAEARWDERQSRDGESGSY